MNKLKEGVEVDQKFLKTFVLDAIKNPRKFYALLTLAGVNSVEAYKIIYNLKHPRLVSSNFRTKMQMLALLQNIIELITHDRILYSRLRSMAMSGDFGHIAKNVSHLPLRKGSFELNDIEEDSAPGTTAPLVSDTAPTSIGTSDIAGVAPEGQQPFVSKGAMGRRKKISPNVMAMLKKMFTKAKSGKPRGGQSPNIIHMN